MIKSFVISAVLIATSQTALSEPKEYHHRLQIPMGTYAIEDSVLRNGDMANKLRYQFPLGSLVINPPAPKPAKSGDELRSSLRSAIETNKINSSAVDDALDESMKKLSSYSTSPLAGVATRKERISLEKFDLDSCITNGLKLLKQLLKMEEILSGGLELPEFEYVKVTRTIDAIQARLEKRRGSKGLICGIGHKLLNEIRVSNNVLQVKILSAILSRTGSEREVLVKTAAVSFGCGAGQSVKATWVSMWERLSLIAVFSEDSLPAWETVVTEMIAHSEGRVVSSPHHPGIGVIKYSIEQNQLIEDFAAGKKWLEVQNEK